MVGSDRGNKGRSGGDVPGGLVGGDISELILKPPVQETLDSFNGISDWGLAEEWGSPPSPPPAPGCIVPPLSNEPPANLPVSPPAGVGPGLPPPPPPAPPPAPVARLILQVGSQGQSAEQVIEGTVLIGRNDPVRNIHPAIAFQSDMLVSRRHAQITLKDGKFFLSDLGSSNGTVYNKTPLQARVEVPLRTNDLVELGEFSHIRVTQAP